MWWMFVDTACLVPQQEYDEFRKQLSVETPRDEFLREQQDSLANCCKITAEHKMHGLS